MDPTRPVGDIEANEGTRLLELNGEKALTDVPDQTPVELLVAGFAVVSFSTSVAAIFFHMDPIVTVSGVIGAIVAPFAAFQQQKITEAKYLSQTNKRVEEEVGQLKEETDRLQENVDELTKTVENLRIQKDTLDKIKGVQGTSIDTLQKQLDEAKRNYAAKQVTVQQTIVHNIMNIARSFDLDRNNELSDSEIDQTIVQLESIEGVKIDKDKVRTTIIQNGRSLRAIMALVSSLLNNDIPGAENVFQLVEKQ